MRFIHIIRKSDGRLLRKRMSERDGEIKRLFHDRDGISPVIPCCCEGKIDLSVFQQFGDIERGIFDKLKTDIFISGIPVNFFYDLWDQRGGDGMEISKSDHQRGRSLLP